MDSRILQAWVCTSGQWYKVASSGPLFTSWYVVLICGNLLASRLTFDTATLLRCCASRDQACAGRSTLAALECPSRTANRSYVYRHQQMEPLDLCNLAGMVSGLARSFYDHFLLSDFI